ncbi:hypothetical protein Tco_1402522 [Tanacetum coccineum]
MLSSMSPYLQRNLEKFNAYDMLKELKTMFEEQAKQELSETVKAFHACKQEDGQSVSSYLLKMKSYLDTLKRLSYVMPNELGVCLILNSLNKDYDQEERIQKDKKKSQGAKGIDKGKTKLAYAPKTKISPPPKRDNLTKDSVYHHCKEVGHWRRNCSSYHAELKKRKNASGASTSGCVTHICNTSQALGGSRRLKHGALSLYVSNGMRAAVEAIGSFDLVLLSGLIIVLDNCHFAPTITRGVVSMSRLVNSGYIHTFTNYGISVSKDDAFYFKNDAHADDADVRPIYDEEPMAEVQTTAEINIFVIGQQHIEQPEFNNEGEVDQNAEQCHDTCTLIYMQGFKEFSSDEQVMTSDHNSSELGIHDHSNELSSSKLFQIVVPPAKSQHTITTGVGIYYFTIRHINVRGHKLLTSRSTLYRVDSARTFRVILFSIHNDEWKSFSVIIKQHCGRPYALSWKPCQGDSLNLPDHRIHKDGDGDASFQLKSDSLPHAHA